MKGDQHQTIWPSWLFLFFLNGVNESMLTLWVNYQLINRKQKKKKKKEKEKRKVNQIEKKYCTIKKKIE